jgi:hypothetical protein
MSSLWLVDIESPLLTDAAMARIDDAERPDRLAWNTFQTLALWDADVWVPRLVEMACGEGSSLEALEWSGASVRPWGASLAHPSAADVVIDGPEAVIVVVATLQTGPAVDELRAAAMDALGRTRASGGAGDPDPQVGFVVVAPPGTPDLGPWLQSAAEEPLGGDGVVGVVPDASGWTTWRDVGELALDLAEESDELRGEAVHQLVSQMQTQFPDAEL